MSKIRKHHLHPLQVETCDSNSRLVVDEDDNGKFRLERVLTPKRQNQPVAYLPEQPQSACGIAYNILDVS